MSQSIPRRRKRTSVVESTGSWSDVSDCESTSHRTSGANHMSNVNRGRKSADSKGNPSPHHSGAARMSTNDNDDSDIDNERLTKSLEWVENGISDLQCNDPQSLPGHSDSVWNHYSDSPSRSSSLPSSGFHIVQRDQDGADGVGHSSKNGSDLDQGEKIKNKLMSAWNNVRHGSYALGYTNYRE